MDREQFDRISRLLGTARSRREALALLVGGGLSATALGADVQAASKRRKRRAHAEAPIPLCPNVCTSCAGKRVGPGANLTKCDFIDQNLFAFDLSSANLSDACFTGAKLTETRFNSANASRACFIESDLQNTSFRGANVSKAIFCGANLLGADFRGSNVTAAQLSCAKVGCNTILPNGKPAVTCASGETCCSGKCVDIKNDVKNCGACGEECPLKGADICVNGVCQCGSGAVCPFPEVCERGDCLCGFGLIDCNHDGNCVECCNSFQCRDGKICLNGECTYQDLGETGAN
ncbi:MAG: pentapeptide repeat-containing protein [Thermomicrobiales bacterium]